MSQSGYVDDAFMEPATHQYELSISAALAKIKLLVPVDLLLPKVAIICGSGLGTLGTAIADPVTIPYIDLPGFLISKVEGHQSFLIFGRIGTNAVVAMLGRFHVYEGHSLEQITFPITLFSKMGCKNVILTNAAGCLNPDIRVGTIVAIHDHISLPTLTTFPTSFIPPPPPYYSRTLRKLLFHALHTLHLPASILAEGTYCWVTGPTFETAAEGIFLRNAGGDVVGASTVPEVLVARREGMEILALSLVTNMVNMSPNNGVKEEVQEELVNLNTHLGGGEHVVSHSEVLAMGLAKAETVKALVVSVIGAL